MTSGLTAIICGHCLELSQCAATPGLYASDTYSVLPLYVAIYNLQQRNDAEGELNDDQRLKVIIPFEAIGFDISDTYELNKYFKEHRLYEYNQTFNSLTTKSLHTAKLLADEANYVEQGTVETLLLIDDIYLNSKLGFTYQSEKMERHLLQTSLSVNWSRGILQNELQPNEYNLGVLMYFRYFEEQAIRKHRKLLVSILSSVDILVLVIMVEVGYVDPLVEHQKLMEILEESESSIFKLGFNLEVVPLVICNNSKRKKQIRLSHFLNCGTLMMEREEERNRTVIFYQAFDQESGDYRNHGWYKIMPVEHPLMRGNLNQTRIVEKIELENTKTQKLSEEEEEEEEM
ncbi:unnamed protein product [Orchesella dallaii]|uniref:Uncharacterized protein n=1 Tax=Orchesella dallaii TaxID=48710 RepID=A0ABP1PTT2_9HEXA